MAKYVVRENGRVHRRVPIEIARVYLFPACIVIQISWELRDPGVEPALLETIKIHVEK